MLQCAFDGHDHSECCAASGVPMDTCAGVCAGNVTRIDYRQFRSVGVGVAGGDHGDDDDEGLAAAAVVVVAMLLMLDAMMLSTA